MKRPWLDRFRLAAAVLVVCNHTSPLLGVWDGGNFFLTRVLARVAVPFFLMVSGCFLERGGWRTGRLLRPPTGREIAAVPLALLPLLFFGMMTLSMLLSAAGLLLCAALSAPLP